MCENKFGYSFMQFLATAFGSCYCYIYHVAMEKAGGISLIYTSSKFIMIYLILRGKLKSAAWGYI